MTTAPNIPDSVSTAVTDHAGTYYLDVLAHLHTSLFPKTYLEIGTQHGASLRLAKCASIAIDPSFLLEGDNVIGQKPACLFFQMSSDDFFSKFSPHDLFRRKIDLAFLDGMHRCEFLLRDFANVERECNRNSIIVLHDCLPVETAMADRVLVRAPISPSHSGAWTGDVWRTLLALKKWRPDLKILALDAPPTGLTCITNLDPSSTVISQNYARIIEEMFALCLDTIGIDNLFNMVEVQSTSTIDTPEKLSRFFWL